MKNIWQSEKAGLSAKSTLKYPALFAVAFLFLIVVVLSLIKFVKPEVEIKPVNKNALENLNSSPVYVVFEHISQDTLERAVNEAVTEIKNIKGVEQVNYQAPGSFFSKHKYILLNLNDIDTLRMQALNWKKKALENNLEVRNDDSAALDVEENRKLSSIIQRFSYSGNYYRNYLGNVYGAEILLSGEVKSFNELRNSIKKIKRVTANIEDKYNIWAGVIGASSEPAIEFDLLEEGIKVAYIAAAGFWLLILLLSLRNPAAVLLAALPPLLSSALAYIFISFLSSRVDIRIYYFLLVLTGILSSISINIIYRYRKNLKDSGPVEAIAATFQTTGFAAIIAAIAMISASFAYFFTSISVDKDFAVLVILASLFNILINFFLLPPALTLLSKINFIKSYPREITRSYIAGKVILISLLIASIGIGIYGFLNLRYDYNFSFSEENETEFIDIEITNQKRSDLFIASSGAAFFNAPSIEDLDKLVENLNELKKRRPDLIGKISSIRDIAPKTEDVKVKTAKLYEIKSILDEPWTAAIRDSIKLEFINNIRSWEIEVDAPDINAIPAEISRGYKDAEGSYVIAVHPVNLDRPGAASRFITELDKVDKPANTQGPIGEPVERAALEGGASRKIYIIIAFSLILIVIAVLATTRSFTAALLSVAPAVLAILLTLGFAAIIGKSFNYYNISFLPLLIATASLNGIFYVARWKEENLNIIEAHKELFNPVMTSIFMAMAGYGAFSLSEHYGLRASALLSIIFLTSTLIICSLIFPAVLAFLSKLKK